MVEEFEEDQLILEPQLVDYDVGYRLPFTRIWQSFKRQSTTHKIFISTFLIGALWMVPFTKNFYDLYHLRRTENPDYDWPEFRDLKTAVMACMCWFMLRGVVQQFIMPLSHEILRDCFEGKDREDRANRSAFCAMKGMYFISMSILGFVVMKDAPWFPKVMGGKGDAANTFDGYPYMNQEQYPLLRGYIMIQLGYHIFSLISHAVFDTSRNDYMEMILHHSVTTWLLFFGYFMNFLSISSLILLIHDVADVWIWLTRALVDTRFMPIAFIFYLVLMIVFVYGRLYVYPFHLLYYAIWYNKENWQDIPGFYLIAVLVHFLLLLHVYWYIILIKLGWQYLTKGVMRDHAILEERRRR